jgi:hypothetical protein
MLMYKQKGLQLAPSVAVIYARKLIGSTTEPLLLTLVLILLHCNREVPGSNVSLDNDPDYIILNFLISI